MRTPQSSGHRAWCSPAVLMGRRASRLLPLGAGAWVVSALVGSPGAAQETVSRIPLVPGLTVLSTLHSADGDRENVVEVMTVQASGMRYTWRLLEIRRAGDTIMESFGRHVRANDLACAPRIDPVFRRLRRAKPGGRPRARAPVHR
jgi:hypothetical protein